MHAEPRWWPAEYEALARYKQATKAGDRIAAEHAFRRLTNICAAKRRFADRLAERALGRKAA